MADPIYVNRTRLVSSLDNRLVKPLNELSKQTRIPKSRLLTRRWRICCGNTRPAGAWSTPKTPDPSRTARKMPLLLRRTAA